MKDPVHPASEASPADPIEADPRAAAMLPPDLIDPGELVLLLTKPSPWYVALASLRGVLAIVLLGLLALSLEHRGLVPLARTDLVLITVGLAGLRIFFQGVDWLGRVYVLTDRRVLRVRGMARIHVYACPLRELETLRVTRSRPEGWLGLGNIGLVPTGARHPAAWWILVDDPETVAERVRWAMNRYG